MDVLELETILRRVVREELAATLTAGPVVSPVPAPAVELPTGGVHPFDLTDKEISYAVKIRGLSREEEKIFRMRVTAWRIGQAGHHAEAKRMKARADGLEKRLTSTAA